MIRKFSPCIYVFMHACTYGKQHDLNDCHVCMYVCIYKCMCSIYMYVCMYVPTKTELTANLTEQKTHFSNIGRLIEDMETDMRSNLNELYIQKTREVVNSLRTLSKGTTHSCTVLVNFYFYFPQKNILSVFSF